MNACGARLLRETADGGFHLGGGCHHKVSQLVDDDDHLRQRRPLGISRRYLVVAGQVAHAHLLDQLEAALHLVDGGVQRARGLLGVAHHRGVQVGKIAVHGELHLLGVDEDELDLVRLGLVEDAHDQAVDAHGFTRAGCTRDEQVRHFVDVQNDGAT